MKLKAMFAVSVMSKVKVQVVFDWMFAEAWA